MKREYFIKGQRKVVEEIDNVTTLKASLNDFQKSALRDKGVDLGIAEVAAETGMAEEIMNAFNNAQWHFFKANTGARALLLEVNSSEETEGKLVKRENGRYAIVTRRLNVQLDPELNSDKAENILQDKGLKVLNKLGFAPNFYEVETLKHIDALDASVELNEDKRFTLAEPEFIEHIPQRLTPTDPIYTQQWQWSNTGQSGGKLGADVNLEKAWDITKGAGIKVGIIDNGFHVQHPDLRSGVHPLSGYFQSSASGTARIVQGTSAMPVSNHGTFCAGMVGARQNNHEGGCGAAPECDMILVACLGDQVGTQTTLARAVAYCADPSKEVPGSAGLGGADIIVCSLGPNDADWELTVTLSLAIEFAARHGRSGKGVAIFWAASNGHNVDVLKDEVVSHPDVIAVVRSNRYDLEDNAARGSEVELIAPGVDVVSTVGSTGYNVSTGTSYAAPCAAGCAALALSIQPAMTRDELRLIMRQSADKIGGAIYDAQGHNDDYGYGRVNALAAVQHASSLAKFSSEVTHGNELVADPE